MAPHSGMARSGRVKKNKMAELISPTVRASDNLKLNDLPVIWTKTLMQRYLPYLRFPIIKPLTTLLVDIKMGKNLISLSQGTKMGRKY
jgi:hypothetical protein